MAEAVPVFTSMDLKIRRIEMDRPWSWLARGWADLLSAPRVGFAYGILAAVTGYVIIFGLFALDMVYLILPLIAGFLIVGPILTIGLYEVSRRREEGRATTLMEALAAFRRNASQIGLMGVALMLLMFLWARIAALLFFLYFGMDPPNLENLFVSTFLAAESWPFLVIGTAVGGVLALAAYAISVVSLPLLLDRPDANVIEAIITSFRTVQINAGPMLFWAVLIVVFTVAGLVTLFMGLILTLPLIGHASWHAYRDLVASGPG